MARTRARNFKENEMRERLKNLCTHCRLHAAMAGVHAGAAVVADKPEVYASLAVLYAVAAWRDAV